MSSLSAKSSTFDPKLSALFASSAGPVQAPLKSATPIRKATAKPDRSNKQTSALVEDRTDNVDQTTSSDSSEEDDDDDANAEPEQIDDRPRKRRRVDENENLESAYLNRLAREEEQEQQSLQNEEVDGDDASSDKHSDDLNSELEDITSEDESASDTDNIKVPVHETISTDDPHVEHQKLKRTVFLGNVSVSAITSKPDKKTLMHHIDSALDQKLKEKIESIRFRSTAFVSDAGPKRAAYAKKELMNETMKSTNAYVVLSSDAAARKVASRLNGTIVLGRHLRADNLAEPMKTDNRRCVFVGNLSFVDEETTTEQSEDGKVQKRKRAKEPADVEEGLWRTFGRTAKVESVRVVRDKETRISKGFAYVQFHDENGVEAALSLDGKKFPPMLPRNLRVVRAKKIMKAERRIKDRGTTARSGKAFGPRKDSRNHSDRRQSNEKPLFEGHRASSANVPKMLKKAKKKRPAVKPTSRSSRRGAAFKATGGKKKRDA